MRPRWIILGLFLAGIVYGTIIWWPERPMWTMKLRAWGGFQLPAFRGDSKAIFFVAEKRKDEGKLSNPVLCRFDALTGKLLSEMPIVLPESLHRAGYA